MAGVNPPSGEPSSTGPRLPFSRAFAQAGFNRQDADAWRRAGWTDAEQAAAWYRAGSDRSPAQLKAIADQGFTPDQLPFLDEDTGIDLRDRVLRNLHRDAPARLEQARMDQVQPESG